MRKRIEVNAPPYVPERYMAVSSTIDGVTLMPYVNGNASTTPITSVSQGSTATSIPTTSPTASASAFDCVARWTNPRASWWTASGTARPQWIPSAASSEAENVRNGPMPSGSETYTTFMNTNTKARLPPMLAMATTNGRR